MSVGLKANVDGSGAIQVGGSDAITLSTGLNATFVQNANLPNTFGFKNRIINGDMRIDQRNNGASVTPVSAQYLVDRWQAGLTAAAKFSAQQNAGAVTPPSGFSNYLGLTSLSAYSVLTGDSFRIQQPIEGVNVADLAWGTASAAPITISFWVRSSLTGTFGGSLSNSTGTRSYPFTYTISAANTWEQKSVTISGDTTGTWLTTNGVGIFVVFSLGAGATYSAAAGAWASGFYLSATGATSVVGTSGATLYITGIQFERGSTATSFDYLDYGRSLIQCQRYFQRIGGITSYIIGSGVMLSATTPYVCGNLLVTMRTQPAGTADMAGTGFIQVTNGVASATGSTPTVSAWPSTYAVELPSSATQVINAGVIVRTTNASQYLNFNAEL